MNEKAHSDGINIQYVRRGGNARRGGRRRVERGSIEPENELVGTGHEHDYSEAIAARGTRVRHLRLPSMRDLRVRALRGKVGGDKEGLISYPCGTMEAESQRTAFQKGCAPNQPVLHAIDTDATTHRTN